MPAPKPPEFRRGALDRVAAGEPVAKVGRELSISESCLPWWMDVDAGRKAGLTSVEHRGLVELRPRNRVLQMELAILKRASASFARENVLPEVFRLVRELAGDGFPVPVARRVLNVSRTSHYDWSTRPTIGAGAGDEGLAQTITVVNAGSRGTY